MFFKLNCMDISMAEELQERRRKIKTITLTKTKINAFDSILKVFEFYHAQYNLLQYIM